MARPYQQPHAQHFPVCKVFSQALRAWLCAHPSGRLLLQVAAFQCLQPFIGTILAFLVLNEAPTAWDLGAIGIVAGLVLVSTDRRDMDTQVGADTGAGRWPSSVPCWL